MLVYKCAECGKKYNKNELPYNEKCELCGSYLSLVVIGDEESQDMAGQSDKRDEKMKQHNLRNSLMDKKKNDDAVDVTKDTSPTVKRLRRSNESSNESDGAKDSSEKQKVSGATPSNIPLSSIGNKNSYTSRRSSISSIKKDNLSQNFIEGKVVSVISDEEYKRYPWEKLADKYTYKQRVANVQNSIYLRCINDDGSIDNKNVVFYGHIKGGIGIFQTGMNLKVYGKYNKCNEYVAEKIISNDSLEVKIKTEMADYIYQMLPVLLIIVILAGLFVKNMTVELFEQLPVLSIIWPFLVSFCGCIAILGKKSRKPWRLKIRTYAMISLVVEIVWLIIFLV